MAASGGKLCASTASRNSSAAPLVSGQTGEGNPNPNPNLNRNPNPNLRHLVYGPM